jgi:hypothetical protein
MEWDDSKNLEIAQFVAKTKEEWRKSLDEAKQEGQDALQSEADHLVYECFYDAAEKVAVQEWDSGGPGAGAGEVSVYKIGKWFVGEDDVRRLGPFGTFDEAADGIGIDIATDATMGIWVQPDYRNS